jgi:hypothetical protein
MGSIVPAVFYDMYILLTICDVLTLKQCIWSEWIASIVRSPFCIVSSSCGIVIAS